MNAKISAEEAEIQIRHAGESITDYCECGEPYSKHKYWQDPIYDYNGYSCPNSPYEREYKFSKSRTERKRQEARVAVISKLFYE